MRNSVALTMVIATILLFCESRGKDTAVAQDAPGSVSASNPEKASNNDSFAKKKTGSAQLVREGTRVQSQHVIFRVTGNRVAMSAAQGSDRFFCLENLNLQRVTDVLRDNPTLTDWTVDYVVTEFKGENYVLIQRAVLSSTALRPTSPEKQNAQ